MPAQNVTPEDLYVCYGHLQGQLAAVTTIAAALAALHPDKATIEPVVRMTETSEGFQRDEAPAAGQDASGADWRWLGGCSMGRGGSSRAEFRMNVSSDAT